jgi:hypothetical protein
MSNSLIAVFNKSISSDVDELQQIALADEEAARVRREKLDAAALLLNNRQVESRRNHALRMTIIRASVSRI